MKPLREYWPGVDILKRTDSTMDPAELMQQLDPEGHLAALADPSPFLPPDLSDISNLSESGDVYAVPVTAKGPVQVPKSSEKENEKPEKSSEASTPGKASKSEKKSKGEKGKKTKLVTIPKWS